MKEGPKSRGDVPWSKRQEIPAPQILDAANQYEKACKLLCEQPPGSGVLLPLLNNAAMAVELYLKCLSAKQIYSPDNLMPEGYTVSEEPAITGGKGHSLVDLLNEIPADVHHSLIKAFDAELGARLKKDLQKVLEELKGAFLATRYPFEQGIDITSYNSGHLMKLVDFLRRFAWRIQPTDRIE